MSLYKEQVVQHAGGKYSDRRPRRRARWRTWAKNQMAKFIRRSGKAKLDDGAEKPMFKGYE